MTGAYGPAAEVLFPAAPGPALLVCEHASNHVPAALDGLGLSAEVLRSHAAWDPGALALATGMAARLGAPLVAGRISRLVYDCNRPPDAPDAILARSEIFEIPGNRALTDAARAARATQVYQPFRRTLAAEIARRRPSVLITVHSFTPVYCGQRRAVEIGILHGSDDRLARAVIGAARGQTGHILRLNEPYGPDDGVAHTLDLHGNANGLLNVMIEVRNDLIPEAASQARMADLLSGWITRALAKMSSEAAE